MASLARAANGPGIAANCVATVRRRSWSAKAASARRRAAVSRGAACDHRQASQTPAIAGMIGHQRKRCCRAPSLNGSTTSVAATVMARPIRVADISAAAVARRRDAVTAAVCDNSRWMCSNDAMPPPTYPPFRSQHRADQRHPPPPRRRQRRTPGCRRTQIRSPCQLGA